MTPARILIVEDDRVVSRDIQQQLTRIGHAVVGMTANGEDVLRLALSTQAELVLMDIRLEGAIDSVDAAGQVRKQCHIPIVFLTAYADDQTVERASLTEPFGYLLKPFEDSQLQTVIEMALYKHAAERKLRESERRFVTTLSSIGDAVIATDNNARVAFMNPVAERLTGWPQSEAAGRPVAEVFHIVNEDTRKVVEDPATKVLRMGTVIGLANHTLLLARDGREVPIDDYGSPIIDDQGGVTGAVLVFRDIARQRQAEEGLRKAQADLVHVARLMTMGELTASIAHEVNQPLLAIRTNAETCLLRLAKEKPDLGEARQAAERIIGNSQRAADVIRRVRGLVRKSFPEMTQLDMNGVIADILDLIRAELRRRDGSLETRFAANLEPIVGDRVLLQQVVLNLVMNGIEAMADVPQSERVLKVSTRLDGERNVRVSIEDSGPGLDPQTSDRIFEPFFTTKLEGIGMGLSICRTILESHGGRVWAAPHHRGGSIFSFTIPTVISGKSSDRSLR